MWWEDSRWMDGGQRRLACEALRRSVGGLHQTPPVHRGIVCREFRRTGGYRNWRGESVSDSAPATGSHANLVCRAVS